MSGADISEANLKDCLLWDVRGFPLNYEPKAGSNPYIPSIASLANLSELTYKESPHGLVDLREGFKKFGYRKQEREVTYAIKFTQRRKLWNDSESNLWNKIESLFNLVFFEWTCAYGMKPGRPILILLGFIFLFTMPYAESISRDDEDGIWAVWVSDRVRKDIGRNEPVRLSGLGLPVFKVGFYFSIISAFSIGWRELNVGNWITRMQRWEYVLKATGWVRTVSGIQSLLSVYLLALWVLTYFGRPF